jgi:ribosomal-protein-alanine N-acetyltransferase
MNVSIRKMTLQDVPAVAELDRNSFSLPWPERAFVFEVAANPAARCWIAEDEHGRIVGMLVMWLIVDEAHIATLASHPEFRKQGIGAHLLTQALQAARAEGARRALLEVRAGNEAAQAMYRKFGFEAAGRRPRYYKDNGEDAILMTLDHLEAQ